MSVFSAVLLAGLAQGGPTQLSLPSFRVSLLASEDLDPDRLRPLARDGVSLWLSTRSNTLRESTLENLARFREAWVQLRPPFTASQAQALERAPLAGAFLAEADLGGGGLHRLGHRRLAVRVVDSLDEERQARLRAAKPSVVLWEPGAGVDLFAFALFRQLPGRKVVRLDWAGGPPDDAASGPCSRARAPLTVWWVDVQKWPTAGAPCGQGLKARVTAWTSDEELLRLYRLDPAVELEIEVGADERAALGAGELLRRLEAAAPHAP